MGTNGPLSYLASDGLGSVSEALDGSGNVAFQQLYSPYGTVRYSQGGSPTSHGYTGQQADATTGLDYYHARYYGPLAGQFTSADSVADSVADGLNRYPTRVRAQPCDHTRQLLTPRIANSAISLCATKPQFMRAEIPRS